MSGLADYMNPKPIKQQLHPSLIEVFNLDLNKCPKSCWVAGGAAVNFDKAGDVDVWFIKNDEASAKQFLAEAARRGFPIELKDESSGHYAKPKSFKLIGEFYHTDIGKMVQVLTTSALNQWFILNFDITYHRVAVNRLGEESNKQKNIFLGANNYSPKIISAKITPGTLGRYVKICKRYGFDIDINHLVDCGYQLSAAQRAALLSAAPETPTAADAVTSDPPAVGGILGLKGLAEKYEMELYTKHGFDYLSAPNPFYVELNKTKGEK